MIQYLIVEYNNIGCIIIHLHVLQVHVVHFHVLQFGSSISCFGDFISWSFDGSPVLCPLNK